MPDLFGEEAIEIRNAQAYAAVPGTGPDGKHCKDCGYYVSRKAGKSHYRRCWLVLREKGKDSTILASSPACHKFQPKRDGECTLS